MRIPTALLAMAVLSAPAAALVQDVVTEPTMFGTVEKVFLGLWLVLTTLYFVNYKKDESLPVCALKVGCLVGFIFGIIKGFEWVATQVPPAEAIVLWGDAPTAVGPRIPVLADIAVWFGVLILVLILWHARKKFATAGALILSTWDRGHWYMLPVLFIMMTIGLLLAAAAASPVLSPFIYTLF